MMTSDCDLKTSAIARSCCGSLLDETQFHALHGSFAIPKAARLDVSAYLDASRRAFAADDSFLAESYDEREHAAKNVIFCTGIAALREKQLPAEWFQPAKGEILTLRILRFREDRIINRGLWLMRIGDDLYRAGGQLHLGRSRRCSHGGGAG